MVVLARYTDIFTTCKQVCRQCSEQNVTFSKTDYQVVFMKKKIGE